MINRRHVFTGLAAGTLALGAPRAIAAQPASTGGRSFLLVHGAWHNSACWQLVAMRLSAGGHRVLAIDLPGHGVRARFPNSYFTGDRAAFRSEPSPNRTITLDDAATAVLEAARSLGRDGEKPVVVGHSIAGTVISRAAELDPQAFGRLVYLAAFVPVRLKSPAAYEKLPEARGARPGDAVVGDPAALGAVRIDPRGDAAYLEMVRQAFYGDVAFDAFLPYAFALTPDLPLAYYAGENELTRARWGRVPRSYIRCDLDRALAPALQDLFVREADAFTPDNPFAAHRMVASHSPFASKPDELTALLDRI